MATPVTHPTFYEGEILPAADLVASISYPRGQLARHERFLHTWGIASGLTLSAATVTGGSPVLAAGIAIDGTGREVVVPADVALDPADFESEVYPTNDPKTLYPVFLTGLDVPQTATSNMTGACGTSQPTSAQETYTISFGSPGDELSVSTQTASGIADGPGDNQWKILVGFVTWDSTKGTFSGVANFNPTSQIGPQYVGVNGAHVVSGSGSLILSTHPPGFSGANPVLALSLDEDPNGGIAFGSLNVDGTITETLTIAPNGDITTKGQIRGAIATGTVQVESGLATHGTVLPLPSGVTQAQVDSGGAVVHSSVSLRLNGTESTDGSTQYGLFPLECYVDNSRTVHCRVRRLKLGSSSFQDIPAVCEYVVVTSSKST